MKVLIVDDEPLVRRSLCRAFKGKGHEVDQAENGIDGYQKIKNQIFDIVFLDVLMPGLTGPQVLQKVGKETSTKFILMSAFSGEHNMETANQMGADLFIPKPFDDIFEIVRMAENLMLMKSGEL
jgi:two-component system, response regulator PdtaR